MLRARSGHRWLLDHLIGVASNAGGMLNPSAFAVLRLIASSNFVGYSIGKLAGLAPRRILSTVGSRPPETGGDTRAVGHEAASLDDLPLGK
jgi:hypothetical protein